jgi:dienelactone hydrolase
MLSTVSDRKLARLLAASVLVAGLLHAAPPATLAPAATRASFLKMIDRPRVPLAPEVRPLPGGGVLEQFHFSFAAESGVRVPGILIKSKAGEAEQRLPAVIVLHGTGGNKESQIPLLKELATKGFLAVAIDGRYHGERAKSASGSADYSDAMLRTYRTGKEHPFLYDTVWDVMRLIDYLETRPDADGARIGLIGFSKGGMEGYLAAAVEPRIRVAVPCIGVQSFRWAIDHDAWKSRVDTFQAAINGAAQDEGVTGIDAAFVRRFYDRVAPGIYSDFDGPAMLPLIAPRPLLTINGGADARTPMPGLLECINAAKQAYAAAGAADKFDIVIEENTGHRVNPDALETAVAWFVRWLEPRKL